VLEAFGENVQQKTADKFFGANGHDLLAIAVAVILAAELNLFVLDVEQTVIGDGDAVRVARRVFQKFSGPEKGALA
jgi:hypothetical protein